MVPVDNLLRKLKQSLQTIHLERANIGTETLIWSLYRRILWKSIDNAKTRFQQLPKSVPGTLYIANSGPQKVHHEGGQKGTQAGFAIYKAPGDTNLLPACFVFEIVGWILMDFGTFWKKMLIFLKNKIN